MAGVRAPARGSQARGAAFGGCDPSGQPQQKIGGPFLGVLVIRIIVYCSLFWSPLFMEALKCDEKSSLPLITITMNFVGSYSQA